MFVVTVSFDVKKHHLETFLEQIKENAASSKREEDGCLQFDVCCSNEKDNVIYLYEIYTNENSFNLHLKTDHFLKFDTSTNHMILRKTIKTFSKLN